jgi:hypothetical protein
MGFLRERGMRARRKGRGSLVFSERGVRPGIEFYFFLGALYFACVFVVLETLTTKVWLDLLLLIFFFHHLHRTPIEAKRKFLKLRSRLFPLGFALAASMISNFILDNNNNHTIYYYCNHHCILVWSSWSSVTRERRLAFLTRFEETIINVVQDNLCWMVSYKAKLEFWYCIFELNYRCHLRKNQKHGQWS